MKDHGSANNFPCGDSKLILPEPQKPAAPADVVFSRLTLEPNEFLLVRIPRGVPVEMVHALMQNLKSVFKEKVERVLVFEAGSVEFTKVEMNETGKAQVPGN